MLKCLPFIMKRTVEHVLLIFSKVKHNNSNCCKWLPAVGAHLKKGIRQLIDRIRLQNSESDFEFTSVNRNKEILIPGSFPTLKIFTNSSSRYIFCGQLIRYWSFAQMFVLCECSEITDIQFTEINVYYQCDCL